MLQFFIRYGCLCLVILALSFGLITPAQAEVIADGTLSTVVTTSDNLNFTVEQGQRSGPNLFYSLDRLVVPENGSVHFNNAQDIENIFVRVTGSESSTIDGLVSTNGVANLFLIEQQPLKFELNASLQLGGSFVPTTAQAIQFSDGSFDPTTNSSSLPSGLPTALQFGQSPASIEIEGPKQNLAGNLFTPIDPSNSPQQLTLSAGKTFALVGGELDSNGGIITVPAGHIEFGAVDDGATIGLIPIPTGFTLDYSNVSDFGTIRLRKRSLANVSGAPSGSISVNGNRVRLRNGSLLLGQNLGDQAGGDIVINAIRAFSATGTNPDNETTGIGSGATNETLGTGAAGNIFISAPKLKLEEGASIYTKTFSTARGGNIQVNAPKSIDLTGAILNNPLTFTVINALAYNTGNGGDVTVSTKDLTIMEAASINAGNLGAGSGGNVLVNADVITVKDVQPVTLAESNLGASNIGTGQIGNVMINTRQLFVYNGALITAENSGNGSAGTLTINASELIEISGVDEASGTQPSLITASTLKANPELAELFGLPEIPTGNAGIITIKTPELRVLEGGAVAASNEGLGDAGLVKLRVSQLMLEDEGVINVSSTQGHGGTLELSATALSVKNNSMLAADAIESGNAGIQDLVVSQVTLESNSSISADAAQTGTGGIIEINASGVAGSNSEITAVSQQGQNGTIHIMAPEVSPDITIEPTPFVS